MNDMFRTPQPKQPREHQKRAFHELRLALGQGRRRPVMQAPTGAGKTFLAAMIVESALAKGNRVCFTVPALSLIEQTLDAFAEEGITDVGVMQAWHPRTNPSAPVQVASVQTLARREKPSVSLVIVDEAHVYSKVIEDWKAARPELPFIGLSATPWRPGMAEQWDDLIVAATVRELIDKGLLSPFRAFAPSIPDLSGVKVSAGDYQQDQLSEVMSAGGIVADVVQTWLERAEDRPTLCFAVDRAHAAHLQRQFEAAGVSSAYVDAYTDAVERKLISRRLVAGDVKVICNCRTMTTGVDLPIGCIVDAAPTRSESLHIQKLGRGLRVNEGLPDCVILDHAGNCLRLGMPDEIHHDALLSGKAKKSAAGEREAKEKLPTRCGKCAAVKPAGVHACPSCGFAPERQPKVETAEGELVEVTGKAKSRQFTMAEKQAWLSGLRSIAREKGKGEKWVLAHYCAKMGVWPRGLHGGEGPATQEIRNFVKSRAIAFAKSKKRRAA